MVDRSSVHAYTYMLYLLAQRTVLKEAEVGHQQACSSTIGTATMAMHGCFGFRRLIYVRELLHFEDQRLRLLS